MRHCIKAATVFLTMWVALAVSGDALGVPYTFTQVDVPFPGASDTVITGVNNAGQIVGWYRAANQFHGFVKDGSTFTAVDVSLPGASNTRAIGLVKSIDCWKFVSGIRCQTH